MKKYTFILVLIWLSLSLNAQQWTKNLPLEKSSSSYLLHDYQKAFYSYWEPFGVKNGVYLDKNGDEKKAAGWKQFKRWEYYWKSRVDPNTGEFPTLDINALYNTEKQDAAFKNSGELWSSLGPNSSDGGYAGIGRINTIAYHPTNPNMFWVGTASGGLWVTADGGQNWTILNDNMQALGVSDILIPSDFATTQTIYLATGDRDAYDTRSIGLLKSTNAGVNWESIGMDFIAANGAIINRALLNPVNNTTLIVAGNFGVYQGIKSKLKDSQESLIWTKLSSLVFIDVEFKPGDVSTLYASTKTGTIYVSTDNGLNWTQKYSGGYRIELAVSAAQPTWVYALAVSDDDGLFAILKSENSGDSYTNIYDGTISGNNLLGWDAGVDIGGQGWYDLALAVSPTNANTVLVGGINTWLSTNAGVSWTMVNHWYGGYAAAEVHADKHHLSFQTGTGVLFEGNDGGIYKTSNYTTWTDLSDGIVSSQIYRLGTSATVPGETIAGLQDNGTKLLYQGNTWEDVKGGDGTECIIDYTNVSIQYGAYVNGEISKTTNRWYSSTDISDNIPGGPDGEWVTPYIMNPKDPKKLLIGYTEIWRTKDAGVTFEKASNFLGDYLISLATAPSDTAVVYAATYTKIQRTSNSGALWTDVTANLPVGSVRITSIAVKANDPNIVWVTMSGYSGYGVYESVNGGQSWTNISSGLPSIPCNTLVQNKFNITTTELYVGTDLGVYLKLGSNPWTLFSTGLPNVVVSELEIYYDPSVPLNSKLKAATYGRGLWETKVYDSSVQTGFNTLSKYKVGISPNPSDGQFKLDFADYNGENIAIEIRSLTGQLVYKNSFSSASNSVNLGTIANGIYVLQITKGSERFGQNIVIQK